MSGPRWRPAYIGLGSNLDEPVAQVRAGLGALGGIDKTLPVLESGLYRSAPLGPKDQPDFINAVAAVLTRLEPFVLLAALQALEDTHGRNRDVDRWGPRTLDLDLLSYSAETIDVDELTLPHPGIADRNFVLLPWREIAPRYHVPGLESVAALAARVSMSEPRIERIE